MQVETEASYAKNMGKARIRGVGRGNLAYETYRGSQPTCILGTYIMDRKTGSGCQFFSILYCGKMAGIVFKHPIRKHGESQKRLSS